ncbi:hypothetical protein LEP1GSC074_3160 [Leptospira noguchii str. Hook]|uniref:Uncharacterized protein n=1 Tax=Leptospira noguchii serovar Autumnalis str. ZUN142 TaxID=1085540 RepID=M6UU70_9LEPT|nr:hypothetical protein LEP1GSC186_0544 [Leptospira noguchii serovar Autumnalis str. ZUN142]EMO41431.1 hypothetical protein LEP1GSC186_2257 [Leptospira noguchii serovar Autumnalis str. ZUN142]EMO41794.1 hypothetical protein LEP1GSC186_1986 [Leptospira noguchii serovar Autumnalis str. ZUN142]EMS88683.1 hypothetical protein LEP1GSC074_3160 [Leptospira noguchii str. Hook]
MILKSYSTCGVGYDSPWIVRETQRYWYFIKIESDSVVLQ